MNVRVTPSVLTGEILCPASKSVAHRALIAAAFSDGPTILPGTFRGDDVFATVSCLRALGATILETNEGLIVEPAVFPSEKADLYVGASGSTFRFMLPVVSALGTETNFSGTKRLAKRPVGSLLKELSLHGATYSSDALPFTAKGKLSGRDFHIDGSVSSQYVTGLLLALPLLGGGTVTVENGAVSKNYLDITVSVMRAFGVNVTVQENVFTVNGSYRSPKEYACECDWSSASFFAVAGANGRVLLKGLTANERQGDKAILDALKACGATVKTTENGILVEKNARKGFSFNVEDCPDAAPVLSVLGAMSEGKTVLSGTSRLKWKESDRSAEIVRMLTSFGIDAEDRGDRLEITGGTLRGCDLTLPDDHRIAMAACVAASAAHGETRLLHAECVNKSYPDFFEDFNRLGGKADVSLS